MVDRGRRRPRQHAESQSPINEGKAEGPSGLLFRLTQADARTLFRRALCLAGCIYDPRMTLHLRCYTCYVTSCVQKRAMCLFVLCRPNDSSSTLSHVRDWAYSFCLGLLSFVPAVHFWNLTLCNLERAILTPRLSQTLILCKTW